MVVSLVETKVMAKIAIIVSRVDQRCTLPLDATASKLLVESHHHRRKTGDSHNWGASSG